MGEDEKGGGKIVPLESMRSQQSGPMEVKGKSIPLPLRPRTGERPEWEPGYFPISLKQYYRTILIEHKERIGIGNQSLRDEIMAPEDQALSDQYERLNGRMPKKRLRDTRLTLDDVKKWLSPNSFHHLGDPKFTFVNRYVQELIVAGELNDVETKYSTERKYFHQQALRDIFSLGFESEEFLYQLDGYNSQAFLSTVPSNGNVKLPTSILLVDGFSAGISAVTMLFSDYSIESKFRAANIPKDLIEVLCSKRFPIVLRGYLILTAKFPSGDPPYNPYIEGKLILTNEEVQVDLERDMRHMRYLSTALIQIRKNADKEVINYGVTVDATDYPEEVAPLFLQRFSEADGSDFGAGSPVRLMFGMLDTVDPLVSLAKKFSGVYPA